MIATNNDTRPIRTVLIGCGYRGKYLLELMMQIAQYEIVGIADPCDDLIHNALRHFPSEKRAPKLYNNGGEDYQNMLQELSPDLAIIASPWELHTSHALASLEAGADVAIEIKGALDCSEYTELTLRSKELNRSIFPLENTFFMQDIMSIYRMVQEGIFGQLVHCQGGYRHDLRKLLVDGLGNFGETEYSESIWRSPYYEQLNGDLYPTHGLAPLCMMLGINRGNRFSQFTAFSTQSFGIRSAIQRNGGPTHPDLNRKYEMGDIITSIIRTQSGAQITLLHDTTLPRPRSLNFEIQGTKAIWNGDLHSIYIEDVSPHEQWESDQKYIKQYTHPFWEKWGEKALIHDQHHQGMDYIMLRVLAEEFSDRNTYPFGIEDLSTWASVTPLSIKSIKLQQTLIL